MDSTHLKILVIGSFPKGSGCKNKNKPPPKIYNPRTITTGGTLPEMKVRSHEMPSESFNHTLSLLHTPKKHACGSKGTAWQSEMSHDTMLQSTPANLPNRSSRLIIYIYTQVYLLQDLCLFQGCHAKAAIFFMFAIRFVSRSTSPGFPFRAGCPWCSF